MTDPLSYAYWFTVSAVLWCGAQKICARNPALRPWQWLVGCTAVLWVVMPVLKKCYIDELFPPSDAIIHEDIARYIADRLSVGDFREAMSYFSIGNPAYRFVVGCFYAVSSAEEVVVYTINAAFGFHGMLAMLELLCMHSGQRKLSMSAVLVFTLLPSGLLWTSSNLKEGPVLWAGCMLLYWIMGQQHRARASRGFPVLGIVVLVLFRPHIACVWLATVMFVALIRNRNYGVVASVCVAFVVGAFLLKVAAPDIYSIATSQGISTTLNDRYDDLTSSSRHSSKHFSNSKPILVYTGLTLISLRPWPGEIGSPGELSAALEVWFLALLGLWNWRHLSKAGACLRDPSLLGLLVGLLLFGFFFSYMYNMGLVVRQRLMAMPALLLVYYWPTMVSAPITRRVRSAVVPPRMSRVRVVTTSRRSVGLQ